MGSLLQLLGSTVYLHGKQPQMVQKDTGVCVKLRWQRQTEPHLKERRGETGFRGSRGTPSGSQERVLPAQLGQCCTQVRWGAWSQGRHEGPRVTRPAELTLRGLHCGWNCTVMWLLGVTV